MKKTWEMEMNWEDEIDHDLKQSCKMLRQDLSSLKKFLSRFMFHLTFKFHLCFGSKKVVPLKKELSLV